MLDGASRSRCLEDVMMGGVRFLGTVHQIPRILTGTNPVISECVRIGITLIRTYADV